MHIFFSAVKEDHRVKPTHISLYAALLTHASTGNTLDFAIVPRKMLLQEAKISVTTFHRCMRELHRFGYASYMPSYNPKKKSKILLTYGNIVCADRG